MNTAKTNRQEQRLALLHSFQELHSRTTLSRVDIEDWLADNIRQCCEALTGRPYKQLSSSLREGTKLTIHDEKPVLEFSVAWYYTGSGAGEIPDLAMVETFLSGIKLENRTGQQSQKLIARATLDLTLWPNIVNTYIGESLDKAWFWEASESFRHDRLAEAKMLLRYFHPNVRLDELQLAAELGMIEHNSSAFTAWLAFQTTAQNGPCVEMPSDLGEINNA